VLIFKYILLTSVCLKQNSFSVFQHVTSK